MSFASNYDRDAINTLSIEKVPSEVDLVDVMGGSSRWQINVQNHGFVALVDCMPRMVPRGQTADSAIVQAARVSYGAGTKRVNEDRGLIRYLARHRHTTPFEMVEFKFHCKMPMFVARQWIRHRTASVNEYSARYSVMHDQFYRPASVSDIRLQSKVNKQGSDEASADEMTAQQFLEYLDAVEKHAYGQYEDLLKKGMSREQARIGLPVNIFTEWYWKCDLHNIFHFLSLRMDSHAQKEIRDYANAMFALIRDIVPIAAEAFLDYRMEGLYLSRLEVEALVKESVTLSTDNKRENLEWKTKLEKLGLWDKFNEKKHKKEASEGKTMIAAVVAEQGQPEQ